MKSKRSKFISEPTVTRTQMNRRRSILLKRVWLGVLIGLVFSWPLPVSNAQEKQSVELLADKQPAGTRIRLDIPGITDRSIDAFAYDLKLSVATDSGARGIDFGPITVTKAIDKASVKLLMSHLTGEHIPLVKISWFSTNAKSVTKGLFFLTELRDVTVIALHSTLPSQRNSSTATSSEFEEISFEYRTIQVTYFEGDLPTTTTFCWDRKFNLHC